MTAIPVNALIGAAIADRDHYDMVLASGESEHFTDSAKAVWEGITEYYTADDAARSVDGALLARALAASERHPKRAARVAALLASILEASVSVPNVRAALESVARERIGDNLARALAVRRPRDEVMAQVDEYLAIDTVYAPRNDQETDWAALIGDRTDPTKLLKVSPPCLNRRLNGGVLAGHSIVIYARPEGGKTAMALTMACGFARRGHRVLYTGNEDPVSDLAVRAAAILTGWTVSRVEADPALAAAEAKARGGDNLLFRDLVPGTLGELERLVKALKPSVLVVDQLRNLRNGSGDRHENYTQNLDKLAQGVRSIGKKYAVVTVAVTQAGDSASGRAVLGLGDVDSSNTGIPGATDILLGIGVTETLEQAGMRMLSLAKNKRTGRHDTWQVALDPATSKFRSIA